MALHAALSEQKLCPTSQYGFFKTFPQEIRDNIYDLLYQEFSSDPLDDVFSTTVRIPHVEARLVSRQFKLEYDERIAKNEDLTALDIHDTGTYFFTTMFCPPLCTHTTNVTISLYACHNDHCDEDQPCDTFYRMLRLQSWILDLVNHLPYLRSIRVSLELTYEDCLHETMNCLHLGADMPKVVDVTLRNSGFRISGQLAGDTSRTTVLGTWTKQRGFEYDFDAIKLCRESGGLRWSKRQVE